MKALKQKSKMLAKTAKRQMKVQRKAAKAVRAKVKAVKKQAKIQKKAARVARKIAAKQKVQKLKRKIKQKKAAKKAAKAIKKAAKIAKLAKKGIAPKPAKSKPKKDPVDPKLVRKYKRKIAKMFRVAGKKVSDIDMPRDLPPNGKIHIPHFIGKKPDLRMPRDDASADWKPLQPLFKNMSIANHDDSSEKLISSAIDNRKEVQEVMDLFPHPVWPPMG